MAYINTYKITIYKMKHNNKEICHMNPIKCCKPLVYSLAKLLKWVYNEAPRFLKSPTMLMTEKLQDIGNQKRILASMGWADKIRSCSNKI